jgi:AcrR family transcriptional regulator
VYRNLKGSARVGIPILASTNLAITKLVYARFMDLNQGLDPQPTPAAHRPRLSSTERREAIVQAALSLFSEKGFRGVTTRELAAAVGVTEPVLYQHFKTKRELYRALIETQCQLPQVVLELQAYVDSDDDSGFFRKLGMTILAQHLDDPRFAKLLLHSALDRHELADLFFETTVSRIDQRVEAFIAARIDRGAFRAVDPSLIARAFVGMFVHMALVSSVFRPDKPLGDRQLMVEQMVSVFLTGLKKEVTV